MWISSIPAMRVQEVPERLCRDKGPTMLIQKYSVWIFLGLIAIGSARIVSTYHVFSHTLDEPAHIACGMQYLSEGVYNYELQHPPLARVAAAVGPYLAGVRFHKETKMGREGLALLYEGGRYDRNLFLARAGILPFFWIASMVVYVWAKRSYGEPCASFSVLLFTFLPPVLAHAGLATTDMALTAMVGAAFLMGLKWVEQPTARNSTLFGAVTALAVVSKFSSLVFLPSAAIAALIGWAAAEKPKLSIAALARKYAGPLCLAATSLFFVVWAVFRFSVGHSYWARSHVLLSHVPFPELFGGIKEVIAHDRHGHHAFLLGRQSQFGWWYFFLVVLAVKTPLPFLVLLSYGITIMKRAPGIRTSLAFSLGILLICLPSHINIGVRHILPVYLGFSITAGAGGAELLRRSGSRAALWTLAILGVWMIATSALAHPDYLPYFNALAGKDPSRVLVDSDLDWGQDVKRLAATLREGGAQQVFFTPFSGVGPLSRQLSYDNLAAQGVPAVQPNSPFGPSPGWNAVSLSVLRAYDSILIGGHVKWPDQVKPPVKIGKSIWLWYFPPAESAAYLRQESDNAFVNKTH